MIPFFNSLKSHISLYRKIYSILFVILLLAGFESITFLYTNLFSVNKKIAAYASSSISCNSGGCYCTLHDGSATKTGNGKTIAEGAFINDANGNWFYCDANANPVSADGMTVSNRPHIGSSICDQSLADNNGVPCIKVSNLYCSCDTLNKQGGSFGCWTVPNARTGPDFKRSCTSSDYCNQKNPQTPNGWPCGVQATPTPTPPPSQGQSCGINSDAGKGATCQTTCGAGSTPVSSSNNNCGNYAAGSADHPYYTQYACCIPAVSACEQAGGTCCTDGDSPQQTIHCRNNYGPYNGLSCNESNQGCYGPKQSSGAPDAPCGTGSNPPGNDNGWCGKDNNVYYCYLGVWNLKTTCSNGCQVNAGTADTCTGDNSSGNNGNNSTPSNTPTPTATSTPTNTPTATLVPPTNTPTGPIHTTANITIHIEGMDASNIPNVVPAPGLHGTNGWPFTIYIYQAKQSVNSTPYQTYTDTMQEIKDPTSPFYGMFQNTSFKLYDAYKGLPSGDYKFVVRTPVGSLRKQIGTKPITIAAWASNNLVTPDPQNPASIPTLLMGDLNGDNIINTVDLNILIDCYGEKSSQPACIADKNNILQSFPALFADFLPGDVNDNGKVDGVDYTTLLTNYNLFGN